MSFFMASESKNTPANVANAKRQNSTSDYPLVDLRAVCEFVQTIRDKGVESEAQPVVAKACGFAAPTSTPFYRRMAASRLFKMIEPQSARLTSLAMDYVKPDSEDAKTKALRQAVRAVPAYQALLEKYTRQKLNADILKNGIVRTTNLSDDCALSCAKVFIESLRFAGELDADHTLLAAARKPQSETPRDATHATANATTQTVPITGEGDLETYYLTLNAAMKRRVIVQAPPSVTASELKRIQDWLSFQLLVDENKAAESGQ
jgi:hypothetical protein